jgi:hypothetical protein
VVVATTNSGAGGAFEATYDIPSSLVGLDRIAIRLDGEAGDFSYNWFWNNVSTSTGGTGGPVFSGVPTFSIVDVVTDSTVKIETNNFPVDTLFTVRMGDYGTLGVGGIEVATTNSGAGGTFNETYNIPDSLKGSARIAIRLDSSTGFFAYNWFWNNTAGTSTGGTGGPVFTGIPTFSITAVDTDSNVTIVTNNFPVDVDFTVRMGAYGTLAVGGVEVGTFNSGAGGTFDKTFDIPDSLKGSSRIAIRADSTLGFFAYNWFFNNSTGTSTGGTGGPVFTGVPTFSISSVSQDNKVTITTNNFPVDVDFTVRMGAYGTLGVGGVEVGTFNSGAGGTISKTFTIPDSLHGSAKIAIRADSSLGFFAYNWFWNTTA